MYTVEFHKNCTLKFRFAPDEGKDNIKNITNDYERA